MHACPGREERQQHSTQLIRPPMSGLVEFEYEILKRNGFSCFSLPV